MGRLFRIVHSLLIHLLALSLSMVAFYPQFTMADGGRRFSPHRQAPKVCCCGTSDGRCCGMACCGMERPKPASPKPAKGQDELPRPEGDGNRLVLAIQANGPCARGGTHGRRLDALANCICASHLEQTLQAEHVRLQI